jgi:hypothetical protein
MWVGLVLEGTRVAGARRGGRYTMVQAWCGVRAIVVLRQNVGICEPLLRCIRGGGLACVDQARGLAERIEIVGCVRLQHLAATANAGLSKIR